MARSDRETEEEREDRVWRAAVREVPALIEQMAATRAQQLVRREIHDRELVERGSWGDDQPSASEVMRAMLGAIEKSAKGGVGTFVGAHLVALRACRDLGVEGADLYPVFRRTRAQVEQFPNPEQPPEGMSRPSSAVAAVSWPPTLPEKRAGQLRWRSGGLKPAKRPVARPHLPVSESGS